MCGSQPGAPVPDDRCPGLQDKEKDGCVIEKPGSRRAGEQLGEPPRGERHDGDQPRRGRCHGPGCYHEQRPSRACRNLPFGCSRGPNHRDVQDPARILVTGPVGDHIRPSATERVPSRKLAAVGTARKRESPDTERLGPRGPDRLLDPGRRGLEAPGQQTGRDPAGVCAAAQVLRTRRPVAEAGGRRSDGRGQLCRGAGGGARRRLRGLCVVGANDRIPPLADSLGARIPRGHPR